MKVRIETPKTRVKARDMQIGQVGKFIEGFSKGDYVLRCWNGLVSLTKPQSTWTMRIPGRPNEAPGPDSLVELVPTGSKITLTV
jgi:hypothetical protein